MEKDELLKFHEKLYFHEIEYRDKITARFQLPLAIYISFLSLLGFMVRNINFTCRSGYLILFIILFIISSVLLIFGIVYFIKAFYGHTYEFIPTANKTEAYRKELNSTYEGYENGAELSNTCFEDYLYRYFHECSSQNSEVNDKRSENLHKANSFIIFVVVPLLITFLIFNFGHVDKNMMEKIEIVEINKPLEIKFPKGPLGIEIIDGDAQKMISNINSLKGGLTIMAEDTKKKEPPPPPPPPPKRLIREDVQIGDKQKRDKKGKE
ncbi:hypothetical protein [Desulfobacter sp.]|uniref:hypothetical protein n=1 Tax=Desulfobacter sp. TaxID=2294 RepID=UPI00257CAF9D|nr:hypothetical protein [Desulfobacter sp.]